MAASTYTDAKAIAASRMFVNVCGDQDTKHGERDFMVGREKKKLCKEYWNIPCEQHVKCYEAAGHFQFEGNRIGMPMNIFCGPDGKELTAVKREYSMGGKQLCDKMDEALKVVEGEKIPYQPWADTRKHLADADAAIAKSEFKKAIECYAKIQKQKNKSLLAKGEEALKLLDAKGAKLIEEAKAKLESDPEAAKKTLKMVADQFTKRECQKVAQDMLKELDAKK